MRVLVADDERLLAETVAEGLRRLSIAVDVCYDGDAALELVSVHRYDVAVLDRDMPGRTGDEVCRHVVANRDGVRVLMLTLFLNARALIVNALLCVFLAAFLLKAIKLRHLAAGGIAR